MPQLKANRSEKPIYLDYQATTPTDPRVVKDMMPYFTESFGNPHSVDHAYGWEAEEVVDKAREQIADAIGADPREIVFTSGATESNNLAIKGTARFIQDHPKGTPRDQVVTAVTEHKCVLESVARLEREGFDVVRLSVDDGGLIDLNQLEDTVSEKTALVSLMAVNNEIGVIQNLTRIGEICKEVGAKFHSDAAQAIGKIPLDVNRMQIDLMSISGHKIYGPKGIGALYVRRRPRVRLEPLMDGGGQERGFRSGTLATPLCVGLGAAAQYANEALFTEYDRLSSLSVQFRDALETKVDGLRFNGDEDQRIPGNLNITFEGVSGADIMKAAPKLALSMGSACTSADLDPSYVLKALGHSDDQALASLRIGFGRFTTEEEVDEAVEILAVTVKKLRLSIE
ncbi:aminotransferase class V-fold PLP-dependent enzyme [Kiloniella sp. EL199]|uniref:aminotransferase class V-fold PLP-dependent enzyme n=1 Tax=Kiloniella sp. EL199 TaxID=2107581 RepID=UPI000EA34D95|nr:aminotransferase class V-fold PLP-dependent enzyme [Kiloniella sp. EL199]